MNLPPLICRTGHTLKMGDFEIGIDSGTLTGSKCVLRVGHFLRDQKIVDIELNSSGDTAGQLSWTIGSPDTKKATASISLSPSSIASLTKDRSTYQLSVYDSDDTPLWVGEGSLLREEAL